MRKKSDLRAEKVQSNFTCAKMVNNDRNILGTFRPVGSPGHQPGHADVRGRYHGACQANRGGEIC
jgi:hypothetical protein